MGFLNSSALEFSFDVFKFHNIIPGHELSCLMYYLFDKLSLFENLEIDTAIFTKFARKIQEG